MNKIRKTLVVVFSALFVLCMALFAAGCNETNTTAEDPEAPAQSYSVSVDVNDASLGDYTITEASEDGGYAQGSLVTVTVSPKADYEAEVYVNGEAVALENNAASFSVEADTTVQVKYTYKIVANASVTGGKGTVSLSAPADGSKYASGESVTVTATPEAGYTLKSLTVNGATLLAAESDGAFVATFDISEKSYVFAEFVALRTVTIVNDADKGAVDVKLADGTPLKDGDLVAEGTELTLTVKERGSNTVKAVYVAGAYTALNGGKATFTVKGDTEVKVLYNTYYYITIPDDSEGGTITLTGGEKVGNLGYLEGTVLTLSVTVNPGYTLSITKLVGGEEEAVELTNGKYVFTVTEAVEFNIVFAEGTYSVTTEVNNTKYGTVALVDAPEEGYAYNATATLAVTPEPGYTVDYVTVNGDKIKADESVAGRPLTYSFPVTGDTQVFVCFVATERYTVSVELGQLFAQYSAEEDAEFLAALKEGITLGGNTVKAKDEFISLECYKGQEVVLAIAAAPEDGFKFFYYENDAKERTLYAGEVTLTVTGDISIRLTAEAPAELTATLVSKEGENTIKPDLGQDVFTKSLDGDNYIVTLKKPAHQPIGATAYLFKSWTVMQGTEELTANSDGTYTIPYENNADNLALTITANWVVGYKIPVDGYEIQEGSDTVATARIVLAEGTLEGMIGDDRYAEAKCNAKIFINPKDGYRIKQFMFSLGTQHLTETYSELGEFAIGAQIFLSADLTFDGISAQKIYKVSTESENVALTVTGTEGKVHQYLDAEGKVVEATKNVYMVDADTLVTVTVTADDGYYLTKVYDNTADPAPTHTITGDTTSTFTLTPAKDITITAETAPYLSAKVTFEKAENVEEAYTTAFTWSYKRGEAAAADYTDGNKTLKAGDVLTLELQGVSDFAEILVTLNGTALTYKENPTKENIYVYTLSALEGDVEVEVKVTLKPALDFSFPDPEETTGGSTTPAPVQGAWKNLDDDSDSTLQIDAHAVTINGEAVKTIESDGEGGGITYTLTTESGKYELTWFANQVGYILALEDVTPAPAPAGRRNAARAAGAVTYFVSPEYGQSSTYYAQFAQGDTAKLTKIEWTWTDGTGEEATTSTIKITSDLGQVHVELDGENAQYVFCVKAGHYLFVIGTTAYDMTLTLDEEDLPAYITVNKVKYLNPNNKPAPEITEFRSVDMLKDGDNIQLSITLVAENYEDKDAVQADLKLVIGTDEFESYLVNVGEGYYVVFFHVAPTALHIGNDNSADVALKSAAAQKTYDKIVAVLGANHSATFDQDTYTLELSGEGAEQKLVLNHTHEEVVEKTVTFAASAVRLVDGKIRLDVLAITHGFSEEELKTAKLTLAGATVMAGTMYTANGQSNLFFDVTNVAIADAPYKIVLVLGLEGATTEHEVKAPAITPDLDTQTLDGKKYTLSINEGVLYLTVAEDEGGSVTPTEKALSDFGAAEIGKYGEAGDFRILLRFKATGFDSANSLRDALSIKINNVSYTANEVTLDGATYFAYFLVASAQTAAMENGAHKVTVVLDKGEGATQEYENVANGLGPASFSANNKTFTLSVDTNTLTLTVGEGGGEEPTFPQPPTDVQGTDIANGDEAASVTNSDWRYWNDQMYTGSQVNVSVAKMTSNNSIRLWATCTNGACDWGLQLFYNTTNGYETGKTYKLTVTIKSETACTITVNGVRKELAAGATETFEAEFIYRQAGTDQPVSLFDMQVIVANGKYYDLTLTDIAWTEPAKAETGELVEGSLGTEIVETEEGKQTDKFILWWAKTEYGLTNVELTPDIAQVYKEGKISFTYSGGDQTWSVQLFYSNSKLADNTKYFVTLKIKLTASKDVAITVNGTPVTLKAGQDNDIEVLFTNTQETTENKGISSLDIQFPGTDTVDGVDSIGIEISNVQWYYVKGQEPAPEVPTFTFDKNGAGAGDNPEIEVGELTDGDVYEITIPENPFTAPDNTYFRGWEIDGVVYFSGEKIEVEPGATVNLKAVWGELYLEAQCDKSVIGVWGGDVAATGLNIVYGKTTKAVVTYSALGADGDGLTTFAGINVQVIKSANQFYFLRTDVEAALITNNNWDTVNGDTPAQWRNASGTFEAPTEGHWGITTYSDNTGIAITEDAWLQAKLNGRTEILMTLEGGKLTVTENYYTVKTDGVLYVTFSYVITNMTEQSYVVYLAAQKGTEVAEATITTYSVLSANQAPTAENPIEIGTPGNTLPYTALSPVWTGDIKKGEKVVLSGTMTSTGSVNYHVPIVYVYNGYAPTFNIRFDNWANLAVGTNVFPATTPEGWKIASSSNAGSTITAEDWFSIARKILTKGDVEIIFDYTGDDLLLTIKATGTDATVSDAFGVIAMYTFTLQSDTSELGDNLKIGIGGEACYMSLTSLVRTSVKSDASSHAEERVQLTKGGNVTFNGSITESDNVVIKLDLGDSAIYFGKGGLSESLNGEAKLTGSEVGGQQVSISPSQEEMLKSGDVTVTFTLSGDDLTVHYTIASAGSGLDGVSSSYTVSITGLTGDSYTLSVAGGSASVS